MKKISYRLVYNRKNCLNANGKALIQIEAYLDRQKAYFSTHIYVRPEEWDARKGQIVSHPQEEYLNRMLDEFLLRLQYIELKGWKEGKEVSLSMLKEDAPMEEKKDFFVFGRTYVEHSRRKDSTKNNLSTTLSVERIFPEAECVGCGLSIDTPVRTFPASKTPPDQHYSQTYAPLAYVLQ